MKKSGISLITLIITIVIVIILAAIVILSLSQNNPIGTSRVASITQTRDSLQSGVIVYAGDVAAKTLGGYSAKQILIDNDNYKIVTDNVSDNRQITKNGSELTLYKLHIERVKSKLNLDVKENWYIDQYGIIYLLYENIDDVSTYYKEDSQIMPLLSSFVVVSGSTISSNEQNNGGGSQVGKQPAVVKLSTKGGALKLNDENDTTKTITVTDGDDNSVTITEVALSGDDIATATYSENVVTLTRKNVEGNATLTITAGEDETHSAVTETYNLSVWSGTGVMPLAAAKAEINLSNISSYIGTEVAYSPTGGGRWRVFYLDTTNKYGDGYNALYLKRDYDAYLTVSDINFSGYTTSSNTIEEVTAITNSMKKMNKEWAIKDGVLSQRNEYVSAYLCNPAEWTTYKTSDALYAVGSPSVEMYMDAYNQWGGYASGRGPQSYKFDSGAVGYDVGINGSYPKDGCQNSDSLSSGPNDIFCASNKFWWLASPSRSADYRIFNVDGNYAYVDCSSNFSYGVCPIVCLGN